MAAGLNNRRFTWAPKALAVISCALALLAAQPAPAGGLEPALRKGAVVVREVGVAGLEMTPRVTETRERERETVRPARLTLLSGARQWRILATMEILQRLLSAELRGGEGQAVAGMWVDESCVGMVAEPVRVTGGVEVAAGGMPIRERAFAIRHCLLAPPWS